jgi:hypothetical protein
MLLNNSTDQYALANPASHAEWRFGRRGGMAIPLDGVASLGNPIKKSQPLLKSFSAGRPHEYAGTGYADGKRKSAEPFRG